jgi:hypothetical protein
MKSVVALVLMGLATHLHARTELVIGEVQGVRAPFCTTQSDAEAIARADSEQGIPKAREVFAALDDCATGTAVVYPRRVTYSGKTERGSTVRVVEVEVKMADDTRETFYIITDVDIVGLIET